MSRIVEVVDEFIGQMNLTELGAEILSGVVEIQLAPQSYRAFMRDVSVTAVYRDRHHHGADAPVMYRGVRITSGRQS